MRAVRRPLPDRRDHPRQAPARHRRRRPPRPHRTPRLRVRRAVLRHGETGSWPRERQRQGAQGRPGAREGRRDGPRLAGLDRDLPTGFCLPSGLHRQPPEPLLRDHEQRAVPPSSGEGEAAHGEGVVHAVPGRAVLLPVHPAHGHRHLLDVLLPADGRVGVADGADARDRGHVRVAGAQHASVGGAPDGAHRLPPHGARLLPRCLQGAA